jgi:hypothetical protein
VASRRPPSEAPTALPPGSRVPAAAPRKKVDGVTKTEVAKLQDYLRRKFANASIRVVAMKTGDSAEVFIGDESIGVLADDKEDGDDSFTFRMAILDIDLEEDA